MSLDKAIEHGKEKRKPYYVSKAIDRTCRNHGTCEWCNCNIHYANNKRKDSAESKLNDYELSND